MQSTRAWADKWGCDSYALASCGIWLIDFHPPSPSEKVVEPDKKSNYTPVTFEKKN